MDSSATSRLMSHVIKESLSKSSAKIRFWTSLGPLHASSAVLGSSKGWKPHWVGGFRSSTASVALCTCSRSRTRNYLAGGNTGLKIRKIYTDEIRSRRLKCFRVICEVTCRCLINRHRSGSGYVPPW